MPGPDGPDRGFDRASSRRRLASPIRRTGHLDRALMATVFIEYAVDFWAIGALPLGAVLDLTLGDPRWMPNPVRLIPFLIERAEGGLRVAVAKRGGGPRAELVAGLVLATLVVGLVGGLAWLAVEVLDG